jgi:hypothetical protein
MRGFAKRYGIMIVILFTALNWILNMITWCIFEHRIKQAINSNIINN